MSITTYMEDQVQGSDNQVRFNLPSHFDTVRVVRTIVFIDFKIFFLFLR